ncbi:MAG: hypothetical protein KDA90_24075, partial [Planctomycetaceae bacterium]|nr:hypothetical protein [Planctomycetaceae bacterium]
RLKLESFTQSLVGAFTQSSGPEISGFGACLDIYGLVVLHRSNLRLSGDEDRDFWYEMYH